MSFLQQRITPWCEKKRMRVPTGASSTRRASLFALGGVGLAKLAGNPSASAKSKGNANKRCKRQPGECEAAFSQLCKDDDCRAFSVCCSRLGKCNFGDYVACINQLIAAG